MLVATLALSGAVVAGLLYMSWRDMREENRQTDRVRSLLEDRISMLERDKKYKIEYYQRLVHDDEFAERVVREKLGFSSPGEIVFRFNDSARNIRKDEFDKIDNGVPSESGKSSGEGKSAFSKLLFWRNSNREEKSSSGAAEPEQLEAVAAEASGAGRIRPEFRIDMTGAADIDDDEEQGPAQSSESGVETPYVSEGKASEGVLTDVSEAKIERLKLRSYVSRVRLRNHSAASKNIRFRAK